MRLCLFALAMQMAGFTQPSLDPDQGRQEILQIQISAVTSSVYDDFALRHFYCKWVGLAPKFEFEEREYTL